MIVGKYRLDGVCNGQPCYKKINGKAPERAFIYHWPDVLGGSSITWWIGPDVGGDEVWAGNEMPTILGITYRHPPGDGWRLPFDGGVREGLTVKSLCRLRGYCPHFH